MCFCLLKNCYDISCFHKKRVVNHFVQNNLRELPKDLKPCNRDVNKKDSLCLN